MLKYMKHLRRGFTIVELLIVITVMGILLTLAVINVVDSQVSARDAERKDDMTALSTALESFYRSGSSTSPAGRYPSTFITGNEANLKTTLPDLDVKSATAPNAANASVSLIAAQNTDQTPTGVFPQPSVSEYVYQPLTGGGTMWGLCTSEAVECRKFNLFYRLEGDNTVYMVTSRNQ